MEAKDDLEQIKLMEEKNGKKLSSSSEESSFANAVAVAFADDGGDGDDRFLSELLSQLETLRGDGKLQQPEPPPADDLKELPSPADGEAKSEIANAVDDGGGSVDDGGREEEIVKELREVKRQNFITHCLLSAMIVLTVAWQLSEVTLVLKIKNGLNNPFKSFGSMLTGMLKRPNVKGQNGEKEKESSANQQQIHGPSHKIPEHLPLGLEDSDED